MMIDNLFKNLLITDYYKYLLVVFGFTFIFSIFWPVQILSNSKIFTLSIGSIIYGVAIWILQNYLHTWAANKQQEYEHLIYKSRPNSISELVEDRQKKRVTEYLEQNSPMKFTRIFGILHLAGFIVYLAFIVFILF